MSVRIAVKSFTIENIGSVSAEVYKPDGDKATLSVGKKVQYSETGKYTVKVNGAVAANVVYGDKTANISAGESAVEGAKFEVAATVA